MTSLQTSVPSASGASGTLGLPNLALVGKAGSGRKQAGQLLTELGYVTASFAGAAGAIAHMIWGNRACAHSVLESVRAIDPTAWVEQFRRQRYIGRVNYGLGPAPKPQPYVVVDVGTDDEWWWLKADGFVLVRLEAPDSQRLQRIGDEALLAVEPIPYLDPDYTINNDGSVNDLYDALVDVLLKERKRR